MPRGAPRSGGSSDLEAYFEPDQFGSVLKAIRGFDKDLSKRLRKEIRKVADPAVQEVRQRILSMPTKGGESPNRVRRKIAAGTKVSISTAGRGRAGVRIRTDGSKLEYPRLAYLFNQPSFRHPVFKTDKRNVWVTQTGRPYFGVVIGPKKQAMREGIALAIQQAVSEMDRVSS